MAEATADLKKSMIEKALCQPNWIRVIEVELITRLGTNITRLQHIFKNQANIRPLPISYATR